MKIGFKTFVRLCCNLFETVLKLFKTCLDSVSPVGYQDYVLKPFHILDVFGNVSHILKVKFVCRNVFHILDDNVSETAFACTMLNKFRKIVFRCRIEGVRMFEIVSHTGCKTSFETFFQVLDVKRLSRNMFHILDVKFGFRFVSHIECHTLFIKKKTDTSIAQAVLISRSAAVFPVGSKKGESSHDDEYGHGQEKRRPSTYVEGMKDNFHILVRGTESDSVSEVIHTFPSTYVESLLFSWP